jgi:CDP-diglyceride synthetase
MLEGIFFTIFCLIITMPLIWPMMFYYFWKYYKRRLDMAEVNNNEELLKDLKTRRRKYSFRSALLICLVIIAPGAISIATSVDETAPVVVEEVADEA